MDTSQQTDLQLLTKVLNAALTAQKDTNQTLIWIKDQLREIDLTLQAIVAYND